MSHSRRDCAHITRRASVIWYDTVMSLLSHLKTVGRVLTHFRFFTIILIVTLLVLLARIPLGTFSQATDLDTLAHFVLPFSGAPLAFALLRRAAFLPVLSAAATVACILLIGTVLEVGWEIVEFAVDLSLGLNWQLSNADTMIDLILAVAGSACGGYLFIKLYQHSTK